jgi:hypothetical protein
LLGLFDQSPMKLMAFAPSAVASGLFAVGESWTARQKLGHPARASG